MADRITVLVVDEEPDVLELTETFLEREDDDIAVLTESDPEAAVDRVTAEGVDCVVSDYRMPGMDGLELFGAIADDGSVPFFLVTASADPEVVEAGREAGVTRVVQKGAGGDYYADLASDIRAALDD